MGRHRLARPPRTYLGGRLIAHREHKVESRRARRGKLTPSLAAQAFCREMVLPENLQRQRLNRAFWMTAGAVAFELSTTDGGMVDQGFRKDRSRRVAGAEEQHVEGRRHCEPPMTLATW